MTKDEAIKIIEQAINAGVLKGVYNLSDVDTILGAIRKLNE